MSDDLRTRIGYIVDEAGQVTPKKTQTRVFSLTQARQLRGTLG